MKPIYIAILVVIFLLSLTVLILASYSFATKCKDKEHLTNVNISAPNASKKPQSNRVCTPMTQREAAKEQKAKRVAATGASWAAAAMQYPQFNPLHGEAKFKKCDSNLLGDLCCVECKNGGIFQEIMRLALQEGIKTALPILRDMIPSEFEINVNETGKETSGEFYAEYTIKIPSINNFKVGEDVDIKIPCLNNEGPNVRCLIDINLPFTGDINIEGTGGSVGVGDAHMDYVVSGTATIKVQPSVKLEFFYSKPTASECGKITEICVFDISVPPGAWDVTNIEITESSTASGICSSLGDAVCTAGAALAVAACNAGHEGYKAGCGAEKVGCEMACCGIPFCGGDGCDECRRTNIACYANAQKAKDSCLWEVDQIKIRCKRDCPIAINNLTSLIISGIKSIIRENVIQQILIPKLLNLITNKGTDFLNTICIPHYKL